jgi:hypothetical protein
LNGTDTLKSSALSRGGGYLEATRHPLVCVIFVLPLLLAYELGMHALDSGAATQRNGADVWLRDLLTSLGISALYGAPATILVILLAWGLWRRQSVPPDLMSVGIGMTLESCLFAAGLFGISQGMLPLIGFLRESGLASAPTETAVLSTGLDPACQQILRYLGAGLYEETLFRLVLFSAMWGLFLYWDMPTGWAFLLAGLGSALCFAGAHHVGAHGEPFHALVFLFRTLAGWYFAWIFFFRGFGIAVGAHALYDVLVGILLT